MGSGFLGDFYGFAVDFYGFLSDFHGFLGDFHGFLGDCFCQAEKGWLNSKKISSIFVRWHCSLSLNGTVDRKPDGSKWI